LLLLSAFSFLRLSFWLPWIYSPFPFFMEFRNGVLLQLFECIESTQNEVKRKMIGSDARNDVPRSPCTTRTRKKVHITSQFTLTCAPILLRSRRTRLEQALQHGGGVPARHESSGRFWRSIMEDDFAAMRCRKESECVSKRRNSIGERVGERKYGRFE
jgi:hypothetical protein